MSIRGNRDGKFHSTGTRVIQSPHIEGFGFFGLRLDFSHPVEEAENIPLFSKKVIYQFNTLCLCSALVSPKDEPYFSDKTVPPPGISFRAASIANLAMKPLSTGEAPYSQEWKISAPVWLPSYKPAKKRNITSG
jgi:hypothetical protein